MKFDKIVSSVAALFLVAAPVMAAEEFVLSIDDSFGGGSITVSGYGRAYEYRWIVFNNGGQLAVCGASYFPDASSAVGIRRMLRRAVVELNGKRILRDISFFNQVRSKAGLEEGESTCRNTGVPTPKSRGGTARIVWPSGGIRF
ncbi:hypothetical protein QKW60_07415 [Defluviimonas aestuarii]|uniref:hypothetical protein n=1 Tax=Albidovulum aestuarii TaxID=1130726 RepID=UPI00249A585B|nr:hypothetical protein [Defluviimonas aestuarii]MDI3336229.1 hypothetical protein [Defluviimonas aestuarii]